MMLHRTVHSGTGRVLILAALLVAGWHVWLAAQAGPKIPRDLATFASGRGTVDLRVTLRFPPERFHILMFQTFGRISGTEGDSIDVRGVPIRRVQDIGKLYWVKEITLLREED